MNKYIEIRNKKFNNQIKVQDFQPQSTSVSESVWEKYFKFYERAHKQFHGDDPLPSREVTKKYLKDPPQYYDVKRWLIYTGKITNELIGIVVLYLTSDTSPVYEQNKHIAECFITLDKDYRNRGIGTELLKFLIMNAKDNSVIQAYSFHESGQNFCQKYGALKALVETESRLYLNKVDWNLINNWVDSGPRRANGVTIERFTSVPEQDLEEYCELKTKTLDNLRTDGNLGDLENVSNIITPENHRLEEKRQNDKGTIITTLISREMNGRISGLTETYYNPEDRPMVFWQGFTAVKKEYQGQGLGKWLKAAMLIHIKTTYTEIAYVMTNNATSNGPMLSINKQMGYNKHKTTISYKFDKKELIQKLFSKTPVKSTSGFDRSSVSGTIGGNYYEAY
ncbi:MAG: GNAT family N-acetyltransferase [Candidatus Hodarchaeales archaeon]|jgi:GNAT superfamily N-acetyltransferase